MAEPTSRATVASKPALAAVDEQNAVTKKRFLTATHCCAPGYFTKVSAGIPAALFAFLAGAGCHLSADMGLPPDETVGRINALLCKDNDACMFVTLFVGRLELATGKLEYCNAGHPPIVVVRPDGSSEFLAAKHNVAAGALEGYPYVQETATFTPGTRLLVYTDGVTEAERKDHAQYGDDRLLAFASAHAKDSPGDLVGSLAEELDRFEAGVEQSDDITALAVLVGCETKTETA